MNNYSCVPIQDRNTPFLVIIFNFVALKINDLTHTSGIANFKNQTYERI